MLGRTRTHACIPLLSGVDKMRNEEGKGRLAYSFCNNSVRRIRFRSCAFTLLFTSTLTARSTAPSQGYSYARNPTHISFISTSIGTRFTSRTTVHVDWSLKYNRPLSTTSSRTSFCALYIIEIIQGSFEPLKAIAVYTCTYRWRICVAVSKPVRIEPCPF